MSGERERASDEQDKTSDDKAKRWRLKFSLSTLFVTIAVAAVCFAILWPRHQVWEYRAGMMDGVRVEDLSQLGTEGWELVAVGKLDSRSGDRRMMFYFKRPKR